MVLQNTSSSQSARNNKDERVDKKRIDTTVICTVGVDSSLTNYKEKSYYYYLANKH
jgi:hypothetical protein